MSASWSQFVGRGRGEAKMKSSFLHTFVVVFVEEIVGVKVGVEAAFKLAWPRERAGALATSVGVNWAE